MPSKSQTQNYRASVDQIRLDVIRGMALRAALQLDLFTPLAERPLTADELGDRLGVQPRRLSMLLYQLAASNYLEIQDERFANSPLSAAIFVKGQPGYYGGIQENWTEIWTALLKSSESIKDDIPKAKIDFSGMTKEELGAFLRGLHGAALVAGRELSKKPEFTDAKTFVDIGGGSGGVTIGICEQQPHLGATIVDLPSVVPIAEELVQEAGLSETVTASVSDILNKPLQGEFDIAIARALFQVLSEEQCQAVAENIAASLPPGGTLFLLGFITDDNRISPDVPVSMNVVFLNVFDSGEAYTESQYRSWLSNAGFSNIERYPFLSGYSLISAQKI